MNVASRDEAAEVFNKFKRESNPHFLSFNDFHKGLNSNLIPTAFTQPKYANYSQTLKESLNMTPVNKNFARSKQF
jgi:hypothetical protein